MRVSAGLMLVLSGAAVLFSACGNRSVEAAAALAGGDPGRGKAAITRYGCGACHTISGISSAHGLVGPPLTGVRSRLYVGGVLPNTPANLELWIRNPKGVDPKAAMPTLGVTPVDAADIAAYLYSRD